MKLNYLLQVGSFFCPVEWPICQKRGHYLSSDCCSKEYLCWASREVQANFYWGIRCHDPHLGVQFHPTPVVQSLAAELSDAIFQVDAPECAWISNLDPHVPSSSFPFPLNSFFPWCPGSTSFSLGISPFYRKSKTHVHPALLFFTWVPVWSVLAG